MGSRNKKEKRKQKLKKERARRAKRAHLSPGILGGELIVSPAGEVKMSEVLWEFLEPYAEHWETEEQLRKLLTLGLVAWNAALASGAGREELIRSTAQTIPPEVRADYLSILGEMIHRKETHFAGVKRAMLDYQLSMTPSGPHLVVISTLGGE